MCALYSWLKLFYASSLSKTQSDMEKLKRMFVSITAIFSLCTLCIALFIASIDDMQMVDRMANGYGVCQSVVVIVLSIATQAVSSKLVKQIKFWAKRANANYSRFVVRKLSISGTLIAVCFAVYAVVTLFAILNEQMYKEYDYLCEAVIKLSDICSIAVIFWLYAYSKADKQCANNHRKSEEIERPSNRLSISRMYVEEGMVSNDSRRNNQSNSGTQQQRRLADGAPVAFQFCYPSAPPI